MLESKDKGENTDNPSKNNNMQSIISSYIKKSNRSDIKSVLEEFCEFYVDPYVKNSQNRYYNYMADIFKSELKAQLSASERRIEELDSLLTSQQNKVEKFRHNMEKQRKKKNEK